MIPTVVERCIGIDVGKKFVVACLMVGPAAEDPRVELRQFGTFTEDLVRLKDWIEAELLQPVSATLGARLSIAGGVRADRPDRSSFLGGDHEFFQA
jgi:hypothetical protein